MGHLLSLSGAENFCKIRRNSFLFAGERSKSSGAVL
jgi:hypothetical protein